MRKCDGDSGERERHQADDEVSDHRLSSLVITPKDQRMETIGLCVCLSSYHYLLYFLTLLLKSEIYLITTSYTLESPYARSVGSELCGSWAASSTSTTGASLREPLPCSSAARCGPSTDLGSR